MRLAEKSYDLGLSATAFHWLKEAFALEKIANLLRPGGWRPAVWNVFGDDSRPDPFHEATKELPGPATTLQPGTTAFPSGWIPWHA
jgi:hypothetical protein